MTSPSATLYVIAAGTNSTDGEREFGKTVMKHLNDIGGPLDQVDDFNVAATDRGAVVVSITGGAWQVVSAAKRIAAIYLRGQGLQVVETPPPKREKAAEEPEALPEQAPAEAAVGATEHAQAKEGDVGTALARVIEQSPDPVSLSEALLIESVLTLISERGGTPSHEIAAKVGRPVEVIDRLLTNLTRAGLVAGNVASVFTLTEAGALEASAVGYKGGRKGVVEALLAHGALSTQALAEIMDCTLTVPKKSVRLLINEGMVEVAGTEKTSRRPRRTYRLTKHGKEVGHNYVPAPPGRKPVSWEDPTPRQEQVMGCLPDAMEFLTAPEISQAIEAPIRTVVEALMVGIAGGFAERELLTKSPITYGYRLTVKGRAHVRQHFASAKAREPVAMTRTYQVTVTGEAPEVVELLQRLEAFEGVTVETLKTS